MDVSDSIFIKIRPEPDVAGYSSVYPAETGTETDSVMAAPLLCMLMMCMQLHNLRTKCSG